MTLNYTPCADKLEFVHDNKEIPFWCSVYFADFSSIVVIPFLVKESQGLPTKSILIYVPIKRLAGCPVYGFQHATDFIKTIWSGRVLSSGVVDVFPVSHNFKAGFTVSTTLFKKPLFSISMRT